MNKESLISIYVISVLLYENDELTLRANEAFNEKMKSLAGFKILDIFLFITFYPFYFLVHKIDRIDRDLADSIFMIFNWFAWFVFSPVYFLLIVWNKIESRGN